MPVSSVACPLARARCVSALAARAAFAPLASQALLLDFQTMTADPAGTIRRLEAHTGAQGISGRVFSVRVNSPGSLTCTPPAALSSEEAAALGDPGLSSNPVIQAA